MAQLHCYVPDEVAQRLRGKAEHAHVSVSKYLAQLVKREIATGWPEGYAEIFGKWQGEPLQRPSQGEYEKRLDFE